MGPGTDVEADLEAGDPVRLEGMVIETAGRSDSFEASLHRPADGAPPGALPRAETAFELRSNTELASVSYRFDVDRDAVAEVDIPPDALTVYRTTGSGWEPTDTETRIDGGDVTVEATVDAGNVGTEPLVVGVGADAPVVWVREVRVDNAVVDRPFEATVVLENSGTAAGEISAPVTLKGTRVATIERSVEAGSRVDATVNLTHGTSETVTIGAGGAETEVRVRDPTTDTEVTSVAVSDDEISTGDATTVTLDVRNDGTVPDDYRVAFEIDGTVAGTETVTVPPGETVRVPFEQRFESPGTYSVGSGNRTTTLAVGDGSERPPGGNGTDGGTEDGTPGFTPVSALLALLAAALLARRRRDGR